MKAKLSFFKSVKLKVSYIFAIVLAALMLSGMDALAQRNKPTQFDEVGLFLGLGYYNGEICPNRPFYNPKVALGLNLRHVLNDRVGIVFQAIRCKLEGADKDFSDPYQQARNARFENEVVELSLQGEFNFLPLIAGDEYRCFTPYVAAGPGLTVAAFPGDGLRFCIPFGVGIKYCPNEKVTLSAEWKYRKLFSDKLDQISEDLYDLSGGSAAAKQKSFLGTDDWYSFIGVVLSFRLGNGNNNAKCSAYR